MHLHPVSRIFGLLAAPALLLSATAATPAATPSGYASDLAPGHSLHGEAFNEGPRQQAYLMKGMPKIDFPVTTRSTKAQQFVNQGVGQLHGFWYLEAERSFRQALNLDTNLAMAYWGIAMANTRNTERAKQFLTNATRLKITASRREQLYIDALARSYLEEDKGAKRDARQRRRDLVRDYENLVQEFPDDIEAKAFLIYQVWDNSGFGNSTDLPISSHLPIDALARQILAAAPLHPVHHYRIHLWDPEKPANALDSAARCGQGAPGIAHMWHMPGHTYAKLHRYADAAWQQEASARVDHAHMMRDRVLPDQIHNYTHNNDWLVEDYAYTGRVRDALELAKNMVELPRLMRTNSARAANPQAHAYSYQGSSWTRGRDRLLRLLVDFELWDNLIALSATPYLEPTELPVEQARRAHALGLAWHHKQQPARTTLQIAEITKALDRLRTERQGAQDFAEDKARKAGKSRDDISKAITEALQPYNTPIEQLLGLRAELEACTAVRARDLNAFTNSIAQAKDTPKHRLAQLHFAAGDTNRALTLAREAAEGATNQVLQLALQAALLHSSGQLAEAQKVFQALRAIRATPDLDLPTFQRLAPIAQSLRLPADWRIQNPTPADVGDRPPLDSLGPLHWQPSDAPDWTLTDAQGRRRSLADYRGKPVVMLFFLGRGCSHCMDQLNAFAPRTADFQAAGIEVVAVSTDSTEGLRKTSSRSGNAPFPFPILSDAALEAFRKYRAYDDFERAPLHGTFLVDAEGLIRWQDIGYEPFQEPDFLLAESKRLLSLSGARSITKHKTKKIRPGT